MKSFVSSTAGLSTISLGLNVAAIFALAVPFGFTWNFGFVAAVRAEPISYLQSVAILGAVMVLKMAVVGVKLTASR